MTRLETVARAIYEKRMSQVGIPAFAIVPWEKLPPMARASALEVGQAANDAEDALPASARQMMMMGRRG